MLVSRGTREQLRTGCLKSPAWLGPCGSAAASSGRSGIYQELGVGELADEEYALFRHIEKIYSDLAS